MCYILDTLGKVVRQSCQNLVENVVIIGGGGKVTSLVYLFQECPFLCQKFLV